MLTLPSSFWADFRARIAKGPLKEIHTKNPFLGGVPDPIEIDRALAAMQRNPTATGLRIYESSTKRDDLAAKVLKGRVPEGRPAFDWIRQECGLDRCAFVINELQDWSEPLARAGGSFLHDLAAHGPGIPPGGAELVAFAGNYEGTPFGVHRGFESAFLIHLGPGNKQFHCWSPELFQELTGGLADVFDYRHLMAHATTYLFEPGDLFYLPPYVFHIGAQTEYSVSVAVPLYQPDEARYYADAVSRIAGRPHDISSLPFVSPDGLDTDPTKIEGISRTIATRLRDAAARWTAPSLEELIADGWHARASNGWLKRRDFSLSEDAAIDASSVVRGAQPFRIGLVAAGPGRSRFYARHHAFEVASHPALGDVVAMLNAASAVPVARLIDLLGDAWEAEAVVGLLQHLAKVRAIEVVR